MFAYFNTDSAIRLNDHVGLSGTAGNRAIIPVKAGTVVTWVNGTTIIFDLV